MRQALKPNLRNKFNNSEFFQGEQKLFGLFIAVPA